MYISFFFSFSFPPWSCFCRTKPFAVLHLFFIFFYHVFLSCSSLLCFLNLIKIRFLTCSFTTKVMILIFPFAIVNYPFMYSNVQSHGVLFCRSVFVFLLFPLTIVLSVVTINGFCLFLWYLQTFRNIFICSQSTFSLAGGGPGGSMNQVVGTNNSSKPITNMAWVRARLCKSQKRMHSSRSRK